MKTTVSSIISKIKRRIDYNITDSDLDTLLTDIINDSLKLIGQWLYDAGNFEDTCGYGAFVTIPGQEYVDVTKSVIVGDVASFTGIANDKLKVTIDGTAYDNIDVSACTTIALVVTAINAAVGSPVASTNSTSSTLQITSTTTGSASNVTIADGTGTGQTVVGDLFSDSTNRTSTGIADLGDIIQISERVNDGCPEVVPYDKFRLMYPSPTEDSSNTANNIARLANRIYFGPQPSAGTRYYIEYFKEIAEVTSASTLPFVVTYDPLLIAQTRLEFMMFFDATNSAIPNAKALRDVYKSELILNASYNRKRVIQSASRNEGYEPGPQAPTTGTFF